VRVTFELSAEAWALVERALQGARQLGSARLSDGEALEAVARDALAVQTEDGDASDPRRAVVLLHEGKLSVTGDAEGELRFLDASGRPIRAPRPLGRTSGGDTGSLEALQDDVLATTQGGSRQKSEEGRGARNASDVADATDRVLDGHAAPVIGPPTPAPCLLRVMGRRGGWSIDALVESSALLVQQVSFALILLELQGKVRYRNDVFEPV
jgi:hypothetical protein